MEYVLIEAERCLDAVYYAGFTFPELDAFSLRVYLDERYFHWATELRLNGQKVTTNEKGSPTEDHNPSDLIQKYILPVLL